MRGGGGDGRGVRVSEAYPTGRERAAAAVRVRREAGLPAAPADEGGAAVRDAGLRDVRERGGAARLAAGAGGGVEARRMERSTSMNVWNFAGLVLGGAALFVMGYYSALRWVLAELGRMGVDLSNLTDGEGME